MRAERFSLNQSTKRTGTDRVMMSYEHERVEKDPEKRGYLESGYKKRNRNTHTYTTYKGDFFA